ncbi:MAG: hypothetical protein HC836_04115 [Richelia sp. RM2_1_2]|nr:hypothetical protein [Richelia sp. SM1_7_0]NJN08265.1 hypothetical protein [Richelia sp. RM1_1_1]NJO26341.1 hypothetical protein [Richelia sp. SL_2_1]NJO57588.1 hypothetical protein [Richelia sp. RM2_1_2]
MATYNNEPTDSQRANDFRIEGQIQREQPECQPGELKLAAFSKIVGNVNLSINPSTISIYSLCIIVSLLISANIFWQNPCR